VVEDQLGAGVKLARLKSCIRELSERKQEITAKRLVASYREWERGEALAQKRASKTRTSKREAQRPSAKAKETLKSLKSGPTKTAREKPKRKKSKKRKDASVWMTFVPFGGQPSIKHRRRP
jgi:hypothetical protein